MVTLKVRLVAYLLLLVAVASLWLLVQSAHAEPAGFTPDDTLAAIETASATHGVSYAWLYATVGCETGWTFDPYAVGDHGTSLGAAQLHRGGLLGAFFQAGYDDPYDPFEALDFMGFEFAAGKARAWSCA